MKMKLVTVPLAACWFSVLVGLVFGCATIKQAATPARVEAVAALGAYYGAQSAIADGKREALVRTVAALKVVQASGKADVATIAAAIQAAGITIGSPEGTLAVQGALILFGDLWAGTGQAALDDALARAALAGTVRGIELALGGATRALNLPSGQTDARATLIAEARRTRAK